MPRWAARTDTTQTAIVTALRSRGALVLHIRNPFDLLVLFRGQLYMLDPKTPLSKRGRTKKTESQAHLDAAGWPLQYPRTPDEALAAIGIRPAR